MSNIKQLNKHKNNKNKSEMKHETLTFRFLDMSRGGVARLFLLLLLPCLSVIGVKADSNGGVKVTFNPAVRYSQWAINSRLYDFKANTKAFGFAKFDSKGGKSSDRNNKEIDKLDYVPGLVAKATIEAADYYQSFNWSTPWFLSVKEYGDAYSNSVPTGGGSLDDLNAVKLYIGLYNYNNANATDANKINYKNAIGLAQEGLKAHNTIYSIQSGTLAGDAVVGGWFHKAAYNNQMWLDGAYMGSALLAQIVNFNGTGSSVFGSTTADWDMVFKQLNIVWNMCWNAKDKLMYHAFEANAGTKESNSHADTWAGLNGKTKPYTFHSAAYWGRANAWYLMALVDVLEAMKNAGQDNTTNYTTLKQHLADLAAGIAKCQDSKTGGWYQVMNDPSFKATSYNGKSSTATNYIETSATAIFAAAYFKAVRLGVLSSTTQYDYKIIAKNAFEGLVNNYTYLDENGNMQIWGSCRSAGLGGGTGKDYEAGGIKYRDGSNEYYLLGYDVPMVKQSDKITEGKVLGGFIMAATEYERAYQNQNQDSKQILFAKDLAPSYDFTTTDGKLDATAYGSVDGNITYQWYKSDGTNETKIANATSAIYTPTENGSYYCVATANGKTITTSTTTVKAKNNSNTGNGSTDNSEVIYDFTGSVGTTSYGTSCTIDNNVIKFGSNFSAKDRKYITITPSTGGFKAGDVITLKGYCNSNNHSGVIIYSDVKGSSIFQSNVLAKKADGGGSEFTYTIENDCDALYLGRYGGGTTYLTSLKVERPASSSNKTRLTASFASNADVVVNTTKTATLPTLTVKAGENILAADQYDVVYKSNAEGVATLSGNTITINSLGIATITATVTPKNTDTYEGTTATYQLSVKAPSPLNVSVMDVTINTTDAEEEQPVIKVYGDNDKLLKLTQDYTLSYAVSGDNNLTVDETTGKFSVKKNAEKTAFIKGTSLITVTATPTSSLGSNYTEGKLQFSYSVSEGKIKPVFLESFKGITINLNQDSKNRTITVPLIHDGEDVSSYFKYTYTITPTGNTSNVTGSTLNFTPKTAGTYTVTVSATPDSDGTNDYSDVYDNPESITFTLNVDSKYQTISVTPDPTSIQMYAGTTQVAPDLTVKNGNATLAYTEYNTLWFSTSPGVVKVDAKTGKIEAVSEGTAKIRVVVTGDNLESTTALITIDVDDPAVYRVHANEEYKSQKTMWNQDENLSVTLGGWLFPGTVGGLWTTTESLSSTVEWNYDSSQKNYNSRKASWKITGFDYMVEAGDRQKNARQEKGSNCMPETTLISNADYTKKAYIVDPMFNVPCSGSFLVFQPKTNGTVVAHIYQNGVFDSKKNNNSTDYQYRPQRRVFIMDEAGNFVSSDAHIESTTGKPNGKNYNLSDYKWDMGDKQSPTVDLVKKHFGLESFEMSETGFKNNVYENQLDQETAPNEAATKYPNLKGSRGWSVLADAPVTYTFKVKAGKTYYLYNFGSKIGFYGFSFDEGETKPVEDVVSYDDNTTNTIEATAAGHVAKVTVNRKMTKGIWTTCVLPFSLNRQQVDAIFGNTYSIGNENGTQILYFDRVEGNKVYFVRHAYNTIVAGKPFLIKPTKEVTSINTAEVTDYPYVTIENTEPADWCTGNGYTWASSYNGMTVQEGDGFISNQDGIFKNFVGASGTLKGFRGYLKRLGTQTGAKPIMLQVVNSSNVDGDNGETTGIEDLIIDADGQLMPANGKVYNINGQLVSEDANSFQSLPSGIYIINGKKYIK